MVEAGIPGCRDVDTPCYRCVRRGISRLLFVPPVFDALWFSLSTLPRATSWPEPGQAALDMTKVLGWSEARYREVRSFLGTNLPEVREGQAGFDPDWLLTA